MLNNQMYVLDIPLTYLLFITSCTGCLRVYNKNFIPSKSEKWKLLVKAFTEMNDNPVYV